MFQVSYSDGEIEYFEDLGETGRLDAVLSELNAKLATLPDPRKMHDERRN